MYRLALLSACPGILWDAGGKCLQGLLDRLKKAGVKLQTWSKWGDIGPEIGMVVVKGFSMMTKKLYWFVIGGLVLAGCSAPLIQPEEQALTQFIDDHVQTVAPLAQQANLAYWEAATTGASEAYEKAGTLDLHLKQVYSDPDDFAQLKDLHASGQVTDPLLSRQLDLLLNAYLPNQIEPDLLKQMVDLSTSLEERFSTFRGTLNGGQVTDNQIKQILKSQTDLDQRKQAWLASKQVGAAVADDIVRLVKLRNQAARHLGFENYHTLSLTTVEQDVTVLNQLFDELYELTRDPFEQCKRELDDLLSQQLNVSVDQLRPWHYHDPFFQETPMVYDLDLDVYYQDKDVKQLAQTYYNGLGLSVDSILDDSDLYERDGKNPHAFCTDIDREGDIRILCNLKNNETWMETILHELGHGVYDKYLDPEMPYLLREPAHIFTTEAIAMLFGRLSRNPAWMQSMLDLSDASGTRSSPWRPSTPNSSS